VDLHIGLAITHSVHFILIVGYQFAEPAKLVHEYSRECTRIMTHCARNGILF
jgi:hypothetical protein